MELIDVYYNCKAFLKSEEKKGYSLKFQGFARITQYAKKAKILLFNYQSRVQLTPFTTFCLIYKKASHAYIGKKNGGYVRHFSRLQAYIVEGSLLPDVVNSYLIEIEFILHERLAYVEIESAYKYCDHRANQHQKSKFTSVLNTSHQVREQTEADPSHDRFKCQYCQISSDGCK